MSSPPRTRRRSTPRPRRCSASFHKVSEAMYQRAQEQRQRRQQRTARLPTAPAPNGAAAEEEDVVDAEVVDEGK